MIPIIGTLIMEKIFKFINLPQDKANHAFYLTFAYALISMFIEPAMVFIVVLSVAFAKEAYDWFHKDIHSPDTWDIVYGVVPSFILTGVYYGINGL